MGTPEETMNGTNRKHEVCRSAVNPGHSGGRASGSTPMSIEV
jgi:hypothetical protein